MHKVQYMSIGGSPWSTEGTYGSEASAVSAAKRIAEKYFLVQVLDPDARVVWSGGTQFPCAFHRDFGKD